MAITKADLDALDLAIASGTLEVEFDGRRQKFQTSDAMIRARDHTARVLNQGAAPAGPRLFKFNFTTSRGD